MNNSSSYIRKFYRIAFLISIFIPSISSAYGPEDVTIVPYEERTDIEVKYNQDGTEIKNNIWQPWDKRTIGFQVLGSVGFLALDIALLSLGMLVIENTDTPGGGFGVAALLLVTPFIIPTTVTMIGNKHSKKKYGFGSFLGMLVGIAGGVGIVYAVSTHNQFPDNIYAAGGLLLLAFVPGVIMSSIVGYHLEATARHDSKEENNDKTVTQLSPTQIHTTSYEQPRNDDNLITLQKQTTRTLILPIVYFSF